MNTRIGIHSDEDTKWHVQRVDEPGRPSFVSVSKYADNTSAVLFFYNREQAHRFLTAAAHAYSLFGVNDQ